MFNPLSQVLSPGVYSNTLHRLQISEIGALHGKAFDHRAIMLTSDFVGFMSRIITSFRVPGAWKNS